MARSLDHSSYERYKASLHAIFEGRAPLPSRIRESTNLEVPSPAPPQSTPEVPAAKASRRRSPVQNPCSVFIDALKQASTPDEMQRAVAAMKEAKVTFPAEEDVLSKVLTHPDEDTVLEVLDQLEKIFAAGAPKSPRLLVTRLEDAAFTCKPGAAKDRILALKARLRP